MLKDILVLLGETSASVVARDYAFRLAQETGAGLAGLAGVDLTVIESRVPTPIGGIALAAKLKEGLLKQAEGLRSRMHDAFERNCHAHSIPFEWLAFEGDAMESLYLASEIRDLLVTGHDTAFAGNVHEALPDMIASLIAVTPRPVVICPDEKPSGRDVLVAYDGSLPAMRAIQMFVCLGLAGTRRTHVVSVDTDQASAARRASAAATYLRRHGIEADPHPIESRVHPMEVLNIEADTRGIGTIVMGAYGNRGWRQMLFGSTTSGLVESPKCAMFIYH